MERESFCLKCHRTWTPPPNERSGATYCGDCHRAALAAEAELASLDSVLARRPALDKPTRRENIEHAIVTAGRATDAVTKLEATLARYKAWVSDLQAGTFINCVYCGHCYGPDDEVPAAMADVLKAHIEQCPEHPMSALKAELACYKALVNGLANEAMGASDEVLAERFRLLIAEARRVR